MQHFHNIIFQDFRIPSPPLALFVVMLPKAHLTSHSRLSGSRCDHIIMAIWAILYSSSVYSCHLFLISSASGRSILFPLEVGCKNQKSLLLARREKNWPRTYWRTREACQSQLQEAGCAFGGFICITFLICGGKLVIVSVSPSRCSKPEKVWSTIALTPSILSHSGVEVLESRC